MSPLHDYTCIDCGFTLEDVWFKRKNAIQLPDACPGCGSKGGYERLLPVVHAHFKGEGFYENDYKKKPNDGGE